MSTTVFVHYTTNVLLIFKNFLANLLFNRKCIIIIFLANIARKEVIFLQEILKDNE